MASSNLKMGYSVSLEELNKGNGVPETGKRNRGERKNVKRKKAKRDTQNQ
jgi:hypothetical protein